MFLLLLKDQTFIFYSIHSTVQLIMISTFVFQAQHSPLIICSQPQFLLRLINNLNNSFILSYRYFLFVLPAICYILVCAFRPLSNWRKKIMINNSMSRGYKTFFKLSSAEHEISTALKVVENSGSNLKNW